MKNQNELTVGRRQPDGFASLSADMMERRLGAPSGNFQNIKDDLAPAQGDGVTGSLKISPKSAASDGLYAGPERRTRDISPITERRESMPPRVKVSVRLEPHRYDHIRKAAIFTGRTHQDLMTSALDAYLETLGLPPKR
ncbi:MAG: hypothetical protein RLN89_00190 [Parvibaculum sp.]